MSDRDNAPTTAEPQEQPKLPTASLPPQSSPKDTSNWDNRAFTTPGRRVVIETNQSDHRTVIAE